jgi:hypothetical protein
MFATNNDTMDYYFNPTLSSSWCGNINNCIDIDLTSLAGNSSVLLKFETYNNFNNNLFIDNINIFGSSFTTVAPSGNTVTASATEVCGGETVTFSALDPNNNATQWNWTFSSGSPSTVSGQIVTVLFNAPGTINASVIVGNSIGNSTATLTTPVVVNAIPLVNILQNDTTICADNSIVLNVNGASTYTWSPNTGLSDTTGSTVTALPQQTITYIVKGTSSAGCISYDTINIDTTDCLGMLPSSLAFDFSIYYNATSSFIVFKTGDKEVKNQMLSLYNSLGQIIYQVAMNQNSATSKAIFDCGTLSNGIYFVALTLSEKETVTKKILINKL